MLKLKNPINSTFNVSFETKDFYELNSCPGLYPASEHLSYNEAMQELLDGEASYIAREGQANESDIIMVDEFGDPIVDGTYTADDYSAHDWFIG